MSIPLTLQQSVALGLQCTSLRQWLRLQVGATLIPTDPPRITLAVVDVETRLQHFQCNVTVQLGLFIGERV